MRRNVEVEDLGVCSKLRLQGIGVRQGGCVGVDASAWWAWRSGAPALRGVRWATRLWSGRSAGGGYRRLRGDFEFWRRRSLAGSRRPGFKGSAPEREGAGLGT